MKKPNHVHKKLKFFLSAPSLTFLFLFVFCQNKIAMPPQCGALYGNWFVNPTKSAFDSLCAINDFANKKDSIALYGKKIFFGKAGQCTTILCDSFGSIYSLGFKTPKAFTKDSLYPLVIYLHGGTGTIKNTKGEFAWDMLSGLQDSMPVFLASPSANRNAPWWSNEGISRILQTIRFMNLHYPIDTKRIFLAGVSDGATGCYAASNTIISPFAGFVAISGFGGMLFQMGMNVYPQNIMQRPILNINAGQDQIYPIEEVTKFCDWLTRNGVFVEQKVYADEKHGFDYRAKEIGHLVHLFRTWKNPSGQKSINWIFSKKFPNLPQNIIQFDYSSDSSEPNINGYWRDDTLFINGTGLKSVTVAFEDVHAKEIFVSINKASIRKIHALQVNAELLLNIALNNLNPSPRQSTAYKIIF